MNDVERNGDRTSLRDKVVTYVGDLFHKFWHDGYTMREGRDLKFWEETSELIKIDGMVYDAAWIRTRETELIAEGELIAEAEGTAPGYELQIWAYGRARLEDYCRHQGKLPDGRVVARLPSYGTSREELAELGIESDNFRHRRTRELSGDAFIVILPEGWSLQVAQTQTDASSRNRLPDERFATVYDGENKCVLDVFYSSKPYEGSVSSRTWHR